MANTGQQPNLATSRPEGYDSEMREIFAAMDEVSASAAVQERTLDAIARLAQNGGSQGPEDTTAKQVNSLPAQEQTKDLNANYDKAKDATAEAKGPQAEIAPEAGRYGGRQAAVATVQPRGSSGTKARNRWRAIRIAAVAACLAFACLGGAAYALPAAHVTVETSKGSVELAVNRFGRTLSATAGDQSAQETLDQIDVRNKGYEESLELLADKLGPAQDGTMSLEVESRDDRMREEFEQRGRSELERKEAEFAAQEHELQPPIEPAEATAPVMNEPSEGMPQETGSPQPEGMEAQNPNHASVPASPEGQEPMPGGQQDPGQGGADEGVGAPDPEGIQGPDDANGAWQEGQPKAQDRPADAPQAGQSPAQPHLQ